MSITLIRCPFCRWKQPRSTNGGPTMCAKCGKLVIADVDCVAGRFWIDAGVFDSMRRDERNSTDRAQVDAGLGANTLTFPLSPAALLEVEAPDRSVTRWRVSGYERLDNGNIRHSLQKTSMQEEYPEQILRLEESDDYSPWTSRRARFHILPWCLTMLMLKGGPFLRKYGVAIGLFLLGFHFHAQVQHWGPLWNENIYSWKAWFYSEIRNPEGQTVTARWLMASGIFIWVGVHYGLFEQFRNSAKK